MRNLKGLFFLHFSFDVYVQHVLAIREWISGGNSAVLCARGAGDIGGGRVVPLVGHTLLCLWISAWMDRAHLHVAVIWLEACVSCRGRAWGTPEGGCRGRWFSREDESYSQNTTNQPVRTPTCSYFLRGDYTK